MISVLRKTSSRFAIAVAIAVLVHVGILWLPYLHLPPKNANLNSNITTYQAPLGAGKPLDKTRINPPGAENSKGQMRPGKPPKKTAATVPDSQVDSTSDVPDPPDAQAVAMPKPVRRSLYKNVSGRVIPPLTTTLRSRIN